MNRKIEELKKRQESLRVLKEKNKYFFERTEKTQGEFDNYIKLLPFDLNCKYMTGIKGIISICTNESFSCRFRGGDYYSFSMKKPKSECVRERTLKIEKSL
ncbi:hypothetical protein J4209_04610 [Candidatus Woesearchaeota archaeon]|nr:hypothetical protein [Candidatus Woesearchaeota archaeon]